jgi:NTP pyrophosphatase (non-canonical NTP hydrolase)
MSEEYTPLSFDEYQVHSTSTAVYPEVGTGSTLAVVYAALGLANEAGEAAGKVKKMLRDNGGVMTEEIAKTIASEIGDTLWYAAALASEVDWSLERIAELNLAKLADRKDRGVIAGSGDDR